MSQTENKQQKLKTFLEQMYGKPLEDAEVQEHQEKLIKFFSLLIEIDQRENKKK